jgi:hypothetical protein
VRRGSAGVEGGADAGDPAVFDGSSLRRPRAARPSCAIDPWRRCQQRNLSLASLSPRPSATSTNARRRRGCARLTRRLSRMRRLVMRRSDATFWRLANARSTALTSPMYARNSLSVFSRAEVARTSARSLPGSPFWPFTHRHLMQCLRAASWSTRHRSLFLTGFLSAVVQRKRTGEGRNRQALRQPARPPPTLRQPTPPNGP